MWICGPKALACCLVIAGRGAGRGSRMTLKGESRPFGLLMIGAAVALLAGCSASDGATVTSTAPSSSSSLSSPSPTVTSTSSPSRQLSEFRHGDETTGVHRNLSLACRPDPRSSRLSAGSDRRLQRYCQVGQAGYADPGKDWSADVAQWRQGPVKTPVCFATFAGTAATEGSTRNGTIVIDPTVTRLNQVWSHDDLCRRHRYAGSSTGRRFDQGPRCSRLVLSAPVAGTGRSVRWRPVAGYVRHR